MIESFKNGLFFSPKYDTCTKTFKSAKVVVFANWAPDKTKLSADRWDVRHIGVPRNPPVHDEDDEKEGDENPPRPVITADKDI